MEQTNLYGTYDKGQGVIVNYFCSPTDICAKRSVKSMLFAMKEKGNLPDDETLDCLSVFKIDTITSSDLDKVVADKPIFTFNELLGKEN